MDIRKIGHLDVVFRQVAKLHHQTVHKLLGDQEVFPGQPPVLRLLAERDGRSQRELAEQMEITPATLNVMIGRMEKNGLVQRRPDPADQRVSRVYLTGKGRRAHQEIRDIIDRMEGVSFEHFTAEEKVLFRRLLVQMYENLKNSGIGRADVD